MIVSKGKDVVEMSRQEVDEIISAYERVILDIGAGKGKFIYRLAKKNPELFCIGLETSNESLLEYARKIQKKPDRGGLKNIIFILASIESPPPELSGIADEVFINYPWTNLLHALITGDKVVLTKIRSLFHSDGKINLLVSYDKRYEGKFIDDYKLPELSEDYIKNKMSGFYAECGFVLNSIERVNSDEMKRSLSEWGKRLAFGRERIAWRIKFIRTASNPT